MIDVSNLNYKYKHSENILEDINLRIAEGEIVSIIGKNGSGKSTLARLISAVTIPKERNNFNRWNRYKRQRKGIRD